MSRALRSLTWLLAAGVPWLAACEGRRPEIGADGVRVFAASSLAPAMERLAERCREETGLRIVLREGSSSTLARQIEAGAEADVFLAASEEWVDALEGAGRIEPGTRRELARGSLVIVAPVGAGLGFDPEGPVSLADAFEGRLAMGDPEHVPLGVYARAALRRAGWWDAIAPRVVGAGDARAALALVERGECAAGVVYATDARSSRKVRIVAEIPSRLQDPVVYVAAAVAGRASPAATRFLEWLGSPTARDILHAHGFETHPVPPLRAGNAP